MMKISKMLMSAALAASAAAVSAQQSANNQTTQPYGATNVQAQIRMNIDKNTDGVHFIRDNTDPYVITKVYVLKNADVYELRPYLRQIVSARKVAQDNTFVECIKYLDGTGILIVSAEEDRFGKQENGMGIDEIVAALDQPKVTSSSGKERFLYFPMYRNANDLKTMIYNVGMTHSSDSYELQQGTDKVIVDGELNAVFFYVPKFSKKNVEAMLAAYDVPMNQAVIRYTVYEIYAENDGKMGDDFQSWKNNDGADFFSVGGRYRSNWSSTWSGGVSPTGSNKTQYLNFNPKWNSKYLDFLVSKSKAKILTTGAMAVRNGCNATITKTNNLFYNKNTQLASTALDATLTVNAGTIYDSKSKPTAAAGNLGYYYIDAKDTTGTAILFGSSGTGGTMSKGSVSAVKLQPSTDGSISEGTAIYNLALTSNANVRFYKDNTEKGTETEAGSFKVYKCVITGYDAAGTTPYYGWSDVTGSLWSSDVSIAKGNSVYTTAGNGYGFAMTVMPQINRDASTLSVVMNNTSLIGWKSTGEPRLSSGNAIATDIMIKNGNASFLIGGLEKQTVVRSVGGVPFLREIPGLGWAFATETESTQKSQLVVFGECQLDDIKAPVSEVVSGTMKKIEVKTKGAGQTNSWGFGQYLLDPDKR